VRDQVPQVVGIGAIRMDRAGVNCRPSVAKTPISEIVPAKSSKFKKFSRVQRFSMAAAVQQVPTGIEIICDDEGAFGCDAGLRGGCVLSQSS
jgi:hypothetical protein